MKAFLTPLTCEEEKECLMQLKSGEESARERLILHNMRLVAHVAKKYQGSDEEMEDLISIGTIGLIKAANTFDFAFGNRFATYAIRCIENELLMYFRKNKKTKSEVSLFEPIGTDKEGKQIHLVDVLLSEEPDVVERMKTEEDMKILRRKMSEVLSVREMEILNKRYGLDGGREWTQREIADLLTISRSYVSRIEKRALEKLRRLLEQ